MRRVIQALLYIVLIFLLFILISAKKSVFGIKTYMVLTGSMSPHLTAGDIIFIRENPNYKTGDIITFKNAGIEMTHRILSIKENNGQHIYKTKGDANHDPDIFFITNTQILGKVFFSIPYIGKLTFFLKTLPGLILCIIIPGLLFILVEIRAIKNELQKNYEN